MFRSFGMMGLLGAAIGLGGPDVLSLRRPAPEPMLGGRHSGGPSHPWRGRRHERKRKDPRPARRKARLRAKLRRRR
jgi:hypothetical protein